MFLDIRNQDYEKDITPFLKNGVIIDTSVFLIIVKGIVDSRISKRESPELEKILSFLELIKINNKWDKFFITVCVLTEVCTHLRNDYSKRGNYKEIVQEIMPIIESMKEHAVTKDEITKFVDLKNPVVEIGDISIYVVADKFLARKEKIAILSNDDGLNIKYQHSKEVMV